MTRRSLTQGLVVISNPFGEIGKAVVADSRCGWSAERNSLDGGGVEGNPRLDKRHAINYAATRRDNVTRRLAICLSTLHCRNPIVSVTLQRESLTINAGPLVVRRFLDGDCPRDTNFRVVINPSVSLPPKVNDNPVSAALNTVNISCVAIIGFLSSFLLFLFIYTHALYRACVTISFDWAFLIVTVVPKRGDQLPDLTHSNSSHLSRSYCHSTVTIRFLIPPAWGLWSK
jgi:hypothetical protein